MERDMVNDDSPGQSESLNIRRNLGRGPPLGRHMAAVGVTLVLTLLFWWPVLREDSSDGLHLGNAVLADVSLVLLCLILMLGPVARFAPRMRRFVPWGRELGIAMFVTAGLHVVIVAPHFFDGWNPLEFFFESNVFGGGFSLLVEDTAAAANWVGLAALVYALGLAAISNDFAQRRLGRGWKFLQRQAYTLFILAWLHAALWMFLLPYGETFIFWFWTFTALVVVAQLAGFVHTVRSPRGPSPRRASEKTRDHDSTPAAVAIAKGTAVVALWSAFIIGSLSFGLG
jgi:DMSO/TMAO reductase YedYZ heme-binding membrane subunit